MVRHRNRLEARAAGSAPEADAVAAALRPVLPGLLAATATAGGCTQEVSSPMGLLDGGRLVTQELSVAASSAFQQLWHRLRWSHLHLCVSQLKRSSCRLPALGSLSTLRSLHDLTPGMDCCLLPR